MLPYVAPGDTLWGWARGGVSWLSWRRHDVEQGKATGQWDGDTEYEGLLLTTRGAQPRGDHGFGPCHWWKPFQAQFRCNPARNQPCLGIAQLQTASHGHGLSQGGSPEGTNLPNVPAGDGVPALITSTWCHLALGVRDKTVWPVQADVSQAKS